MSHRFDPGAELTQQVRLWERRALLAGVILAVLAGIGGLFNSAQFFRSYLVSYLFFLGIALGSLGLLMTQYMTGGAWGVVTRRIFEAATRTLPGLAVLFVPLLFGLHALYPWSHPQIVAADDVLRHRAGYMNAPFFTIRAVLYFAIWIGLTYILNRWSVREDEQGSQQEKFERISPIGLILYVFTVTFSSVDWAESIFSDWYSTMWGFLFVAGEGMTAISLAICSIALLARFSPLQRFASPKIVSDLGKLLLMFVMLWAYFAFSQLLIVWSGNLKGEIPWYLARWHGSWKAVGAALILLEFIVPFLLLLSKNLKQKPGLLTGVVALLLVMRLVNLYWVVMPDLYPQGLQLHWLQFVLPLGFGCLWVGGFLWQLRQRPLLPEHAVNLKEALKHAA